MKRYNPNKLGLAFICMVSAILMMGMLNPARAHSVYVKWYYISNGSQKSNCFDTKIPGCQNNAWMYASFSVQIVGTDTLIDTSSGYEIKYLPGNNSELGYSVFVGGASIPIQLYNKWYFVNIDTQTSVRTSLSDTFQLGSTISTTPSYPTLDTAKSIRNILARKLNCKI